MDYLILVLLAACLLIMLVIHQDIVQFGESYSRVISQLSLSRRREWMALADL